MSDWSQITFFESVSNLKPMVPAITGRTPSTALAREISVCLQQGRLFFQSADQSALEIRPLLLFYGTLAFARALIVATGLKGLAALVARHGVKDISGPVDEIDALSVRIDADGTFQAFNDVVARLTRLRYFDRHVMPQSLVLPTASSSALRDLQLTLKEIVSRVPDLGAIYRRTFHEPPLTEVLQLYPSAYLVDGYWELRIDDPALFADRQGLIGIVSDWRQRFPLLTKWRVVEAVRAWGHSIIEFGNVPNVDEFDEDVLLPADAGFKAAFDPKRDDNLPKTPLDQLVSPPGGGLGQSQQSWISPISDLYVSEFALHYLGMFLLSSLVRYRPQRWVHAVTRSVMPENPADDHALALLEEFMTLHRRYSSARRRCAEP